MFQVNYSTECQCSESSRRNEQRKEMRGWRNEFWSVCVVMVRWKNKVGVWIPKVWYIGWGRVVYMRCGSCKSWRPVCNLSAGRLATSAVVPGVAEQEILLVPAEQSVLQSSAHVVDSGYWWMELCTKQHCSSPAETVSHCTPRWVPVHSWVSDWCAGWLEHESYTPLSLMLHGGQMTDDSTGPRCES